MSEIGPAARRVFAGLLSEGAGQELSQGRIWRLDTALTPVLREAGCDTLDQLAARLDKGAEPALAERVIEALLNQETSFFRDPAVFDTALDALAGVGRRRARIWSAGCATGQEPLSLAMLAAEREMPAIDIVATDLSSTALARARAGRFDHFEIQRGLAVGRLMRWFAGDGDAWTARPELVNQVTFRRQNLMTDPAPSGAFDAVFCRNVLLYLAAPARRRVLALIAGALRPGGFLVLGAGETVIGVSDAFRPSARFRGLYERVAEARAAA